MTSHANYDVLHSFPLIRNWSILAGAHVHTRAHVRVSDNYSKCHTANWFSAQFSSRDRLRIMSGRRNEVIGLVFILNTTHFSFCLRKH